MLAYEASLTLRISNLACYNRRLVSKKVMTTTLIQPGRIRGLTLEDLLQCCCYKRDYDSVEYFLNSGADHQKCNHSLLRVACENNDVNMMELLLARCAWSKIQIAEAVNLALRSDNYRMEAILRATH